MRSKTDQIRSAWDAGNRIAALRIGALRVAAQFFDPSNETMIFKRGIDAFNHPDFYRQIGKEPQGLLTTARIAGEAI
jgi:hypothetical protein